MSANNYNYSKIMYEEDVHYKSFLSNHYKNKENEGRKENVRGEKEGEKEGEKDEGREKKIVNTIYNTKIYEDDMYNE